MDIGSLLGGASKLFANRAASGGGLGNILLGAPAVGAQMQASTDFAQATQEKTAAGMSLAQAIVAVIGEKPELYANLPDNVRGDTNQLLNVMGVGQSANYDFKTLVKVGPNGEVIDRRNFNTKDPNEMAQASAEGWSDPGAGLPTQPYSALAQQQAIQRGMASAPGGTNVNVQAGEKEANIKFADINATNYEDLQKAAKVSQSMVQKYDALDSVLSHLRTGKFAVTKNQLIKAADAVLPQGWEQKWGVDVNSPGLADAATSISGELALNFRNPASGGGLTGNTSDRDLTFLQSIPPGLESSPTAIPLMIYTRKSLEQRNVQLAKIAAGVVRKEGAGALSTTAVTDAVNAYLDDPKNDLFAGNKTFDALLKKAQTAGGSTPEAAAAAEAKRAAATPTESIPAPAQRIPDKTYIINGAQYIWRVTPDGSGWEPVGGANGATP